MVKIPSTPARVPLAQSLVFAAILVFGLSVLTMLYNPARFGDGQYYLGMSVALATQGTPHFSPEVISIVGERFDNPSFVMLREASSGNLYAWHFFAYSLVAAPLVSLLMFVGSDPVKGLLLTNVLLAAGSSLFVIRFSKFSLQSRWISVGFFLTVSALVYLWWPHPEVFTASLVFVASASMLDRRYGLAMIFAAIASLQNPSAIFLALLAGTPLLDRLRRQILARKLERGLMREIGLGVIAVLVGLSPYLWSIWHFATLNPIVDEGYIDFSNIGLRRLFSLLFDLDQGVLIYGIGLLIFVIFAVAVLAVSSSRIRILSPTLLLLIAPLLMALPVLGQRTWNHGQAIYSRYGSWIIVPLIVWAAYVAIATRNKWSSGIGASLVGVQLMIFASLGGLNPTLHPSFVEHKSWTKIVLTTAPGFYNPDPEIFAMRSGTPALGDPPVHAFVRGEGKIMKALVSSNNPSKVSEQICSEGSHLNWGADAQKYFHRNYDGSYFLNGPLRCEPIQ